MQLVAGYADQAHVMRPGLPDERGCETGHYERDEKGNPNSKPGDPPVRIRTLHARTFPVL